MIRIDAAWLTTARLDMRAGTALARVVAVFGAPSHHAYRFPNKRANRLKILAHDDIGIWLAARRLHQDKFIWPLAGGAHLALQRPQLDALVMGLPSTALIRENRLRNLWLRKFVNIPDSGHALPVSDKVLAALQSEWTQADCSFRPG
jgi:transposase